MVALDTEDACELLYNGPGLVGFDRQPKAEEKTFGVGLPWASPETAVEEIAQQENL